MARILVINDDQRANAVREALTAGGYEVHLASSPADGLTHAHEAALVVLPVLLPGRDSLQALHDLRRRHANVPIITVTGRPPSKQDARLLEQLGATRVIGHPFQPASLVAMVETALRKKRE